MNAYLEQFDAPGGYLDFAAIGPPGRMVRSAVAGAIGAIAGPEVPITEVLDPMGNTARGTITRFLGTEEDHTTYVFGTSEGLLPVGGASRTPFRSTNLRRIHHSALCPGSTPR